MRASLWRRWLGFGLGWLAGAAGIAAAAGPATITVGAPGAAAGYAATGTVEAVRQGTLGSQVAGRVIEVLVRNGDAVRAGQPLLRIDASEALDAVTASTALAAGAESRLATARADYERARQLRAKEYISEAAMQRAESALRTAEAEAHSSAAQAAAARTRAGWYTVSAPYAGRVTDLWVKAGDLATPGRPLAALYDPSALRVVAQVPESVGPRLRPDQPASLAARDTGGAAPLALPDWHVVPAVDAVTHSIEVRAELPPGSALQPGAFVGLWLPLKGAVGELRVPRDAVVHRSEVTGVYVVDDQGVARLRQVRLGPEVGTDVIVLAGLRAGERVVLDPEAALRP